MSSKPSRRANTTIKFLVQSVLLALICCAFTASASIAKEPDAHQACIFGNAPILPLAIFCPVAQQTAGWMTGGGGIVKPAHHRQRSRKG